MLQSYTCSCHVLLQFEIPVVFINVKNRNLKTIASLSSDIALLSYRYVNCGKAGFILGPVSKYGGVFNLSAYPTFSYITVIWAKNKLCSSFSVPRFVCNVGLACKRIALGCVAKILISSNISFFFIGDWCDISYCLILEDQLYVYI